MINSNLVVVMAVTHPERHFHVRSEIIVCGTGYHTLTYILVFNEGFNDAKLQNSGCNI